MILLTDVQSRINEFICAAISAEYNTFESVDIKTVAEKAIEAIEQYAKEIEDERNRFDNTISSGDNGNTMP